MPPSDHLQITRSPRAIIITVFGLYLRELGGWLSVSDLITLMAQVGIDSQSVRSSVSRLKKRGVLVSDRRNGVAGYGLSEYGESVLVEGDRRICSREEPQTSDWVIAVFSVPESERGRRHALRAKLSWLGFANLSSGTWIAPAHVAEDTKRVLERDGLGKYVELFHGDHLGFGDVAALAGRWWDLPAIEAKYRDFVAVYEPLLARWDARGNGKTSPELAFADYVAVVTDWRRLPYLDPGLPSSLLPDDWPRVTASLLFTQVQRKLEIPARTYVRTLKDLGDRHRTARP